MNTGYDEEQPSLYLSVIDGARLRVPVYFDGNQFAIEEPQTGWHIVVDAWSRRRFEAHIGHLDVIAWREDDAWVVALPECGGAVRLADVLLQQVLATSRVAA